MSLPEGIFQIINELKGQIGESKSAVVRNILIAYLSEQGYFSNIGPIKSKPAPML